MLRRRPARTSAARNEARRSFLAAVGVGAMARVARASELARSSKRNEQGHGDLLVVHLASASQADRLDHRDYQEFCFYPE